MMTTKFSTILSLVVPALALALAMLAAPASVHAFAPQHGRRSIIITPASTTPGWTPALLTFTTTTTALRESIVEAEDRFLAMATNANGVPRDEVPEVVYTIVYNPGTPAEGIHTMKYPRGSDNDVLLCFEGMADCIVFARTIKEDPALDQEPIPTPTSREMMEQACQGMGLKMEIVPMETKTQW